MNKIIILNGGHATGKSTIVKNIVKYFDENFKEIKTKYGHFIILNKNIFFVGKVTTKTTGGDQVGYQNIFPIVLYILKNYNFDKTIILESPLFSGNYIKPLKFFIYLNENYNIKFYNILLYLEDINEIFFRCEKRTNKQLRYEQKIHVFRQYKQIKRNFLKKPIKFLNNNHIKIDNLNEYEVLNKILKYLI